MKKKLVLIVVFLLPALGVFVFKFFSRSHFELRVFYQDEMPAGIGCEELEAPYHIDDQIRLSDEENSSIAPFANNHYKIFGFPEGNISLKTEMNSIADSFYDVELVDIYLIKDSAFAEQSVVPYGSNIKMVDETRQGISDLKKCVFLFQDPKDNAVLVDEVNRIRGYYNLYVGEEVDSLIIETKILLREKD